MITEIKKYIDEEIADNSELPVAELSNISDTDELDYLADVLNYDTQLNLIEWIVSQPFCCEATALKIFWRLNPLDFTKYDLDKARLSGGEKEVFSIIKNIIRRYTEGFYKKTDIHYDPSTAYKASVEIPSFMYQAVSGEEPYTIYDEDEIKTWFGSYLESQVDKCSNVMDLYSIALYLPISGNIEAAMRILRHPLCDKGIALMLFWRFEPIVSDKIKQQFISVILSRDYPERVSYQYEPLAPQPKCHIPEVMYQPV